MIMEWFNNIVRWLTESTTYIGTALGGLTLGGVITLVIEMCKIFKSGKSAEEKTEALKNALLENKELKTFVENSSKKTEEALVTLEEKMNGSLANIANKVNAMLDVQSMVYTTIRDENLRANVMNAISCAKYDEQSVKDRIQNEVDELKKEINDKMAEVSDTLSEALQKVATTAEVATKDEIVRY